MGIRREGMIMWWSAVGGIVVFTLSLLGAPRAMEAQPALMPRIGVLAVESGMASTPERLQAGFREALRERGYVEGQHVLVDYRWVTAGQTDRLNDFAMELVHRKVDLIVAVSTTAVHAAQRATTAIPIVMFAGDPVGTGLVVSLAHPGGNITGIAALTAEIGGNCLELLRELLPTVTHIAALVHATDPFARPFLEHIESAARSRGVRIQPVSVRSVEEFDGAFAAMVHARAGAVIIQPILATPRVAALAVQHRLPAIAPSEPFAEAGGLMAYGANRASNWRSLATYVVKILKDAKPADLPVEQPMKFDLVINLQTAQALGLPIPPTLLFQADKVIQ
jgi:putative tryptophan/tyrosine transport system substrate-binding protein